MNIGLFSGGKDSLTACHYLWSKGELNEVLYCKTGIGLQENVDYVSDICKEFGWRLNLVEPKQGETYEDFVRKFGFPHEGMHSAIMGYLKWHPIRKWARANPSAIFVSGRRRRESARRMRTVKSKWETTEKMTFYAPLFDWNTCEVIDFIKENGLPTCPVYNTMHMSGDCLCGAFSELGESELLQTFHKDLAQKIQILEEKYGGHWGNQSSMCGAAKQSKLSDYICAECLYQRDKISE